MRLTRIELKRFGRFEDAALELPEGAGLHVLHGPNEAGKTTVLDAVTYALHGMPAGRSKEKSYGFRHALPTLRVGLALVKDDGTELHFLRRRGNANTVVDPASDQPAPAIEALLDGALVGVGKDVWLAKHGLSQERLRAGAEALLASGGDAADALFGAATGITIVRSVLDGVRARRQELLADSGRTGELHVAVQAYEAAKRDLRDARAAAEGHDERVAQRAAVMGERDRLVGERAELLARAEQLQAVRGAAGLLDRRAGLLSELAALPEPAAPWTRAEHDELEAASTELDAAEADARELAEQLAHERERLAGLAVDDRLLAAGDAIAALHQRIETARMAREALPGLEAAARAAGTLAQEAFSAAGMPARTADEVLGSVPSPAVRQELADAASAGEQLQRDAAKAAADVRTKAAALQRAEAALAQLGDVDEDAAAALRSLVERAGTLDLARMPEQAAARDAVRAELEAGARALPGCDLDLAKLRSLELPPTAEVSALVARLGDIDVRRAQQATILEQAQAHLVRQREELGRLEGGVDVPDPAQLEGLRSERDEQWGAIRGAVTGEAPLEAAVAAVPAFEAAARGADEYADALARDGKRVGEAARLRSEIERDVAREAAAAAAIEALDRDRTEWERGAWGELWTTCGVRAAGVEAMASFVERVEELRSHAARLAELEQQLEADAATVAGLARELRRVLGVQGGADDAAALAVLLEQARARLAAAQGQQEERAARAQDVRGRREQHAEALHATQELDRQLAAWQGRWTVACAAMDLPGAATIVEAHARQVALSLFLERAELQERADDALAAARSTVDVFAADVAALVAGLGPSAAGADAAAPELAVPVLQQGRERMAVAAAARDSVTEAVERLSSRESLVAARLSAASRRVAALMERVPGLDRAAAEACDAAWAAREQVAARVKDVDDELLETTRRSAAELLELRHGMDDAALAAAAARLGEQAATLDFQLAGLESERDELTEQIGAVSSSEAVAVALQARANALATVEQLAPEYRSLALQEQLLQEFLDVQAKGDMGPVVQLASEYFRRLTCDRWSGIHPEPGDDGRPVLKARRADGSDPIGVEGMSEGTRDQLFLALRLATLVNALGSGAETMPLLVDDILLTFDDERSAATLELLGEIATRMQVVFLTHHARLVELARDVVDPGVLAVVELGDGSAAGA